MFRIKAIRPFMLIIQSVTSGFRRPTRAENLVARLVSTPHAYPLAEEPETPRYGRHQDSATGQNSGRPPHPQRLKYL